MHYAAENNAMEVAKVLIDHGAHLCDKEDFVSPYHLYPSNKRFTFIVLKDGWQPSHVAAGLNAVDVEALLVASGSDPSALTNVLFLQLLNETNRITYCTVSTLIFEIHDAEWNDGSAQSSLTRLAGGGYTID